MTIDDGVAYGEPFQKATASLRFDGEACASTASNLAKATGTITGAAFVGWDGTYSFNADGRRIPAERIARVRVSDGAAVRAHRVHGAGSSTFDDPRYDVRFRITIWRSAQEPVGLVTGTLALRGDRNRSARSRRPRRGSRVTGTGPHRAEPRHDGDLTFRFHDSPLDPYVRLFVPKLSPYTTAVASGTIRIAGVLADLESADGRSHGRPLEMTLFDYGDQHPAARSA